VLGRGLSALLKETSSDTMNNNLVVGNIIEIELEDIEVNPYQPRTYFDEESLRELASSIKELGVIQPITVRKVGEIFQLVSGERRFRASRLIGNKSIPAYIRTANDQEMLEMALVENIQRKNLDPIEVALSYKRLIDEIQLTQEELSIRVGKKRSTVTNYLRLLKLDPILQTGIRDGFISMGHGRALINIKSTANQLDIYEKILLDKLSVRQTEELVKSLKIDKKIPNEIKKHLPNYIKNSLPHINSYLGHKVNVTINGKGKGKISIPFHSKEDFERIKNLLK
jgi:ParB family chromosome partitioning protein